MPRKSIAERLAQIEVQRKTRKVLLGALVLHRLGEDQDGEFSKRLGEWLRRELPGFLTRDADKELFAYLLKSDVPATSGGNPAGGSIGEASS